MDEEKREKMRAYMKLKLVSSLHCCQVFLKGRTYIWRRRKRSGICCGGASEYLIIATATGHLATGYTKAPR